MKFDPKKISDMIPDGKLYQDPSEKGLYLRNRKQKKWVVSKYSNKKRIFITLGSFPEMNLSSARKAASIEKANAISNSNQKHYSSYTLLDVFDEFKKRKENLRSMKCKENFLSKGIVNEIARKNIFDITPDDVRTIKQFKKSTPIAFNRIRALISVLFNFAIREMEIDVSNPTISVQKFPEHAKDSFVPMELSQKLFEALNSGRFTQDFSDIIILLLELGQRKSNTFSMRWDEVDFENNVWTIPKEKSKNKKDLFVPLTPDAVSILKRRKKQKKSEEWVFPRIKKPVIGITKAGYIRKERDGHVQDIRKQMKILLRDIGAPENLTIHDLRRTHGMWMLNSGASIEQVSRSLNHSSIAITQKVYAKLLVDPVREAQALMMEKIKGGKS